MSDWVRFSKWKLREIDLTGILADLTGPLKASKVPIFAVSTW